MRLVILICILMLLSGCAKESDPIVHGDNNVLIVLSFPDDPLIESIVSYRVIVTADDILTPIQQSASYNPAPFQTDTLAVYSQPGTARKFTVHFLQNDGAGIFWARGLADVSQDTTTSVPLDVFQAAAGSASRVKIFRDNLPWNSDALDVVLAGFGLTLGEGENQYQIITSDAMDTVSLAAGEDLIIIANDQSQEFYDNYYSSQPKIDAFINEGGTILWEACDLGWAGGSIELAGLTLPGRVKISPGYQNYNFVTSSLWQLTSGLDSSLYGTYASHEGFFNLPDAAVAYTVDGRGLPTLISFSLGVGWVIVSGQPLEYSFDRSDSLNIGYLLPNIISYLLDSPQSGSYAVKPAESRYNDSLSAFHR